MSSVVQIAVSKRLEQSFRSSRVITNVPIFRQPGDTKVHHRFSLARSYHLTHDRLCFSPATRSLTAPARLICAIITGGRLGELLEARIVAKCSSEGGERVAELPGKAKALHQILKSPIPTDGTELRRNAQINEMERMLLVCFFQQLKCLFVVTKRDVDRRYLVG